MKKICFISLSRSDYSSLKPVILSCKQASSFSLQVIAGGSHLRNRFGHSIEKFVEDGIEIDDFVDFMKDSDNSEKELAIAYGRAFPMFLSAYQKLQPDAVFILGDRWEMLAAVHAASLTRLSIIHHSGGDITQGSFDNQIRYAISVLSHFHMTALDEHKARLEALGEESWRVISVGEPALTGIAKRPGSEVEFRKKVGLEDREKYVLATFHPTSFDSLSFEGQISVYLQALEIIDASILLTAPNPDPGSRFFLEKLMGYCKQQPRIRLVANLGSDLYYTAMEHAEYMIGNSSSGIWEAPSFHLPVVNIGRRQSDRLRAGNVIDSDLNEQSIRQAIAHIESSTFRKNLASVQNPYVKENTLELIVEGVGFAMKNLDTLLAKKFIDPLRSQQS